MGQTIQNLGWRRYSYLVPSKVHGGVVENPNPLQRGLNRNHIFEACHQAISRLQSDYLDLRFYHRPDPEVPMEKDVRAITKTQILVR